MTSLELRMAAVAIGKTAGVDVWVGCVGVRLCGAGGVVSARGRSGSRTGEYHTTQAQYDPFHGLARERCGLRLKRCGQTRSVLWAGRGRAN